jgi:hypothetical protein
MAWPVDKVHVVATVGCTRNYATVGGAAGKESDSAQLMSMQWVLHSIA